MKSSVHIRKLHIHRALGVRRGEGFDLERLSPGINLIYGPNGCGKTTTCRAALELLWPGDLERPSLAGVISGAGGDWQIDIDAGRATYYRDGLPEAAPEFGPAEHRNRYHLGLRALIVDEHLDFAKAVADATQGGYDLERAADDLGFRKRPRPHLKELRAIQDRIAKVDGARREHLELEKEAERLAVLRKEKAEALRAARALELLNKAVEHRDAADRCRDLEVALDAFPEGVARLRGDERRQLTSLADAAKSLTADRKSEEVRISRADAELVELDLPDEGVVESRLHDLRARRTSLRSAETRIREQQLRMKEAAEEADRALRRLGNAFEEEELAALESLEKTDLSTFARKADRLRARKAVLVERRDWLSADEPDEMRSLDLDRLHEGIRSLARWLAAASGGPASTRGSWWLLAAGILVVMLGLGLAAAAQWIGVLLLLAAALLVELYRRQVRSASDGADAREIHRETYRSLLLDEPEAWNLADAAEQLRRLVRLAAAKSLAVERRQRLAQLENELEAASRAEEEMERERSDLEERLGLTVEIDDEWLPLLVDRVRTWQAASSRAAGAGAALAELRKERESLIERFNRDLSPYGYPSVDSSETADENLADLEDRRRRFLTARDAAAEARRRIGESIEPELARISALRSELFARLEIDEARETLIDDWLERRPKFLELKDALARCEAIRDDRRAALSERSDLLELDRADLHQRVRDYRAVADRRDDLNNEMGRIEQHVDLAKAGHSLSNALEERDEAEAALDLARDEDARAVVGACLIDWVRRVAVDRSRPRVFQRANELFVRFTRGTLQLEMDDRASTPSFVARRGDLPIQSLNELSDGERIQLMTAVRLAFLEQDETKPLPLLVDEVLGTSDDGRSSIMIDTMIDVARRGRQVFYCTAQHDEVGKWIARLEAEGLEYRLIDLAEIRGRAVARTTPLAIADVKPTTPPEPNGMCYGEYGHAIGAPGLDPRTESLGGVHLWHVLRDIHRLHDLLSKDISTWGQLHTLMSNDGAGLIEVHGETFDQAAAAARAIETACEAWRVGRGHPVDRAVLLDSGCVSDVFIDRLTELACSVDGRAEGILRALEAGRVSRWRSDKTACLRAYFADEGYLPFHEPLSSEDVRVRVMAEVSDELREGLIGLEFVEQLVDGLYQE